MSGVHIAYLLDDYATCFFLAAFSCPDEAAYSLLEISFSSSVGFVEYSGAHLADETYLIAFDSAGNQLGCYLVTAQGSVCSLSVISGGSVENATGSLFRAQGDISRVVLASFQAQSVSSEMGYRVPEPGTLALLGLGLAGMGFAKRCRRKA